VTGITDQLVAEGWVARSAVEGDRRAYSVALTVEGRAEFQRMVLAHEGWIVDAFAGLNPAEVAQLHTLLGQVKRKLSTS
jgi:DNA-binding MarR family transcriptional regulator